MWLTSASPAERPTVSESGEGEKDDRRVPKTKTRSGLDNPKSEDEGYTRVPKQADSRGGSSASDPSIWQWVKNRYPKWSPGEWKGQNLWSISWWSNFDPYPILAFQRQGAQMICPRVGGVAGAPADGPVARLVCGQVQPKVRRGGLVALATGHELPEGEIPTRRLSTPEAEEK